MENDTCARKLRLNWRECFTGIVKISELQALLESCFLVAIHPTLINVIMLFVGPRRLITKCDTFVYNRPGRVWLKWTLSNEVIFLPKDQNSLEILWDEEIVSMRNNWRKKSGGSRSSIVMRATIIKSATETAGKSFIMAVRFLRPTDLVVDKCVVLCSGFDLSMTPVLFSLQGNKLLILAKRMIVSVRGKVRADDNCLISMLVIHPTLGEISMSIRFCSKGENHTAEVAKMLGGTNFSGFYGFYES